MTECERCGKTIHDGEEIYEDPRTGEYICESCYQDMIAYHETMFERR